MADAIDLDDDPGLMTIEVDDVFAGRMLTPELHVIVPTFEVLPQQHFRQAHRLAQTSCSPVCSLIALQHLDPPLQGEVAARQG